MVIGKHKTNGFNALCQRQGSAILYLSQVGQAPPDI